VKKDYHTYGNYKTNIYSMKFNHNIENIDNNNYGEEFSQSWTYNGYNDVWNKYWIESNTLYFENLPDRTTYDSSSWSQPISITFVDSSHEEFYAYGTTTYYPWDN